MDFYIDVILSILLFSHLGYCWWQVISNKNQARQIIFSSAGKTIISLSMRYIIITLCVNLMVDGLLLWRFFEVIGGQWSHSIIVLMFLITAFTLYCHFRYCLSRQIILTSQMIGANYDTA